MLLHSIPNLTFIRLRFASFDRRKGIPVAGWDRSGQYAYSVICRL